MGTSSNEAWYAGQRVRLAVQDRAMPYGTPGTIREVCEYDLLLVGFDGDPALRLVGSDEVEVERAVGEQ
jgi:hypothetical protein